MLDCRDVIQISAIKGALKDFLKDLREVIGLNEKLSYDEAMKYFIEHKDDSPKSVKGVLLKENAVDGFVITQAFLDKDNQLVTDSLQKPLGYKQKVKQIDDELLRLFKDNDLIIVE